MPGFRSRPTPSKMPSLPPGDSFPWHLQPIQDTLDTFSTSPRTGLSVDAVAQQQTRYGPNQLPQAQAPSRLTVLGRQFANPLIAILLVASGISLLIGEPAEALFIFAIVLFNTSFGAVQEYRAERHAAALQTMIKTTTAVIRAGREHLIDAEALVPGDLVLIGSGQKVPADLRLINAQALRLDEALLTGESQAVEKQTRPLQPDPPDASDVPLAERTNMAYAGSMVASGRGRGIVVATGLRTEVGRIAATMAGQSETETPLMIRMADFSKKIAMLVVIVAVLMGLIAFWQGYPPSYVFMLAVALAVAAIPEGLPVGMTVTLSIGSRRMARRHVIVRRLMAVEGLGSCTYIASDKTGTLTLNRQTVKRIWLPDGQSFEVSGDGYHGRGSVQRHLAHDEASASEPFSSTTHDQLIALAQVGLLCNEATLTPPVDTGTHGDHAAPGDWAHEGDPVDIALLSLAYKLSLDVAEQRQRHAVVADIPYESERALAAKFYRVSGETTGPSPSNAWLRVAVKGSPEKLLPLCRHAATPTDQPPSPSRIEAEALRLAEQGYRVLALATGEIRAEAIPRHPNETHLPCLTLLGLVGMIDPLRSEAPAAIAACQQAGVRVAMITGDHPATALALARQLGIAHNDNDVMIGPELARLEASAPQQLLEPMQHVTVFARVAPLQKLSIVQHLKQLGHYVAVTGDGVNDTPALRAAHIGVAMGSGSDMAKDTATIVITDDNFASIQAGLEEGRFAYANVRKVVFLLISAGVARVVLVALAVLINLPLPLFAAQLLWLNVVANGIQDIALAFEQGEPEAVSRPPNDPDHGIFDRMMIAQNIVAILTMGLISLGMWGWWLGVEGRSVPEARNLMLLLMVLMQNFHAFNARSEYRSVFQVPLRNNPVLVLGVLGSLGIHVAAMYTPIMQQVLHIQPIPWQEWILLVPTAALIVVSMECFKAYQRRRHPTELRPWTPTHRLSPSP